MYNMTPKKVFIVIVFNVNHAFLRISQFIWQFNVWTDNGLQIVVLTYSVSIDSIIQPDPSLIQLSILQKTSWKDWSILSAGPITVLLIELK